MNNNINVNINNKDTGKRVDSVLSEKLPELSRNRIQNLILSGNVFYNSEVIRDRSLKLKNEGEIIVYIPPSNFNVYPYIGFCENKPNFFIDKKEVSMILEPTLASLLEMKITESTVTVNKTNQKVPSYLINDHVLWGATAIMVHEFIILFKQMINS